MGDRDYGDARKTCESDSSMGMGDPHTRKRIPLDRKAELLRTAINLASHISGVESKCEKHELRLFRQMVSMMCES